MSAEKLLEPVTDASVWRRADLERDTSWIIELTPEQSAELVDAAARIKQRGLRAAEFTREDFPLPLVQPVLGEVLQELQEGRGAILIRGLPFDDQEEETAGILLWGMTLYLGRAMKQHAQVNVGGYRDNLIAHIVNQGMDYTQLNVHGSATSAEQRPHCDPSDLVALLCIRPAVDGGGISQIVSSTAIYNSILAEYPEVIDALYEGFYHDLRRQSVKAGEELTPHRIPAYSYFDGHLSCIFNSKTVEAAAQKLGRPLSPPEKDAMETVIRLAADPDLAYSMSLRTGDLQLLNNYTVLHCRSGWQDPEDYARKRVMLRLWLKCEPGRPLAPHVKGGYVTGAVHDVSVSAERPK